MKTPILCTALFCAATFGYGYTYNASTHLNAQSAKSMATNVIDDNKVTNNALVEGPAKYPGGEIALLSDIAKNLVYPDSAMIHNIQGVVVTKFRINEKGAVDTVEVEKSLSKECDEAAVAVVKTLKRFTPAVDKGKPVAVWFRLPIRFRISEK